MAPQVSTQRLLPVFLKEFDVFGVMECRPDLFCHSKPFYAVIRGKFPKDAVKKMNIYQLQDFVVKLVKYTSANGGTRSVCVNNHKNKPSWWPRNILFEFDALSSKEKSNEFRVTLQQLVIKCCEFFRNTPFEQIWLPLNRTGAARINDENSVKTRGVKRKRNVTEVSSVKRRKTLTPKNESALRVQQAINTPVKAVVYLCDIFKVPKKPEPPTQQQFLKSLGLTLNNNYKVSTSTFPQLSKIIKLHNCPHVPISSDVGKAIIKRGSYVMPDYSTAKKIERLEWYINRNPPKRTPQHYEITYVDDKVSDVHIYTFPRKQFHQSNQNELHSTILLNHCKPMSVVVVRDDLISKKKYLDNFKVNVSLQNLSIEQLNKYVCKNIQIRLTRTTVTKSSTS